MYSTNRRSPPLQIIPAAVADQSSTHASCTATLAPSQAGRLKECTSCHKLDVYVARRDMGNQLYLENKSQ